MNRQSTRPDARAAVLSAAAELFDVRGYDTVSIAELTAASGVSNGSLYHHFGSKDGVLAALVVDALAGFQEGVLETLGARTDAASAIRALVEYELRWYEQHPRAARSVIAHRDTVAASARGREPLREINRAFGRRLQAWLREQQRCGALPEAVDPNLLYAIVFAPAHETGKLWLAGRIRKRPTEFAASLGAAAWAGLQAV
ncbi:TetR/AcrR family transcriptional regulator [Nocardia wallacei]|uniref:TetR/AcrR family transcriptional regulator n=1 Tax=Nocardia wallacei TaxID=480035 RepID=UPI0024548FAB|nr:TetR/AcrR family transcriptional regulator [Nocardia wallacei]